MIKLLQKDPSDTTGQCFGFLCENKKTFNKRFDAKIPPLSRGSRAVTNLIPTRPVISVRVRTVFKILFFRD